MSHFKLVSTRRCVARTVGAALLLAVAPARALAHPGAAPQPHDLWAAWSFEPSVVLGLVVAAWWYLRGVYALWRRAGRGRGIARWRVRCHLAGLVAVALALISPIDRIAVALFSVHMVQHLLLLIVAPPLLMLGEPVLAGLWAFPAATRRRIGRAWRHAESLRRGWRVLTLPMVVWTAHLAAVWVWHLPALYDAAVRDTALHVAEHLTFLASSLVLWWVIVDRHARRRIGTGGAVLYLFAAALADTLLGAALTLSRRPWYTAHWGTTAAWGLTPLEDQQLAGLLMWIPAGLIYLVALAPLLVRVLRRDPPNAAVTLPPVYPTAESNTA